MASTYEKIATTTLGSSNTSVTLSSIPSTYTDLVLILNLTATANLDMGIQVNGDTGNNYSATWLGGTGTSAAATRTTNSNLWGNIYSAVSTVSGNFNGIVNFMNYSNTTTYKTILNRFNSAIYGTEAIVALWRNTSAINSIKVMANYNSFAAGSTFTLYGIKSA
jgi:hypothetical protein